MREVKLNWAVVKKKIELLVEKDLLFIINKGRNRIVQLPGKIVNIYPSIFVIKVLEKNIVCNYPFSYNDVMMGNIKFRSLTELCKSKGESYDKLS